MLANVLFRGAIVAFVAAAYVMPAPARAMSRVVNVRARVAITLRLLQANALRDVQTMLTSPNTPPQTTALAGQRIHAAAVVAARAVYRRPLLLGARSSRTPRPDGFTLPTTTISLLTFGVFGSEPAISRIVTVVYDNRTGALVSATATPADDSMAARNGFPTMAMALRGVH